MKITAPFLAFAMLLATTALARWIPPVQQDLPLPSTTVFDESDQKRELSEVLRSSGKQPVLLVPVYTHCHGSCPVVIDALKKGLAGLQGGESPQVALFSFDDTDTADDLKFFRTHEKIPADWRIVRTSSGAEARRFLDAFGFSLMKTGSDFEHSAEVFVLNHRLLWTGSLSGSNLNAASIQEGLDRASASHLSALLTRPETWLAIGMAGLLLSLGVVFQRRRIAQWLGSCKIA